ncbi:MAG: FG-GAP repeat domain-containing protein [Promethearchaeota archaeon]
MIKNKLLIKVLTFLIIGTIIIQIAPLPTNNYIQAKSIEKDNTPMNEIEPLDLGIIHLNYKADGSIMEVEEGINQLDSETPGVESGDHPLGIDEIRFIPNNELAFVCPGLSTDFLNLNHVDINLLENGVASTPYQDMLDVSCSYDVLGGQAVDATSGDVDGDMKDELVIIDEYGRVRIYKYNTTLKTFNITQYNLDIGEDSYYYSISLNQFNTDSGLEIVIGCGWRSTIQIWDPVNALGDYYTPGVQTTTSGKPGGIAEFQITTDINLWDYIMDIETGDFNGNGFCDIVTLDYSGNLVAFECNSGVITQLGSRVEISNDAHQGYPMNFPMALASGDFNGDSRLDIAVMKCVINPGSPEYHCEFHYVETVYWKGFSAGGTEFENIGEIDLSGYNVFYPSIGAGDIDGDGLSETVLVGKGGQSVEIESWWVLIFDDWAIPQTSPIVTFYGESQCPWAAKSFSFSDVDLDGIDEICFSSVEKYGHLQTNYYLAQLEGRNTSVVKINTETNPWTATVLFPNELIIGYPVPGDYDGDAVVIEYSGQHFPRITPQIPIFVLAAPPNYFDLNGEGSGTAVSKEETTSMDVSERFSVMAGMRVSFETGFEFFGTGLKFKTSLEVNYQFSQTQTTTQTETIGVRYSSGHMENQIICDAVDYESYLYTVTKHPKSEMIGKNISIDVPIKVSIYSITESLYNSANSTNSIGSETYTHTPGKPETYPTREEVNALEGVVKIIDKIEVPQGTGTACGSTLKYTRENAKSVEKEHAMELIFSAGIQAGGFGLDVSVGFGAAWANKVTYGESMTYEGTVACISDAKDWRDHKFSWGLFIQNIEPDEGFSYQLVHYYTEDVPSDGTPSEAVPGYNIILVIGVLIISLIVLIYFKKRKSQIY